MARIHNKARLVECSSTMTLPTKRARTTMWIGDATPASLHVSQRMYINAPQKDARTRHVKRVSKGQDVVRVQAQYPPANIALIVIELRNRDHLHMEQSSVKIVRAKDLCCVLQSVKGSTSTRPLMCFVTTQQERSSHNSGLDSPNSIACIVTAIHLPTGQAFVPTAKSKGRGCKMARMTTMTTHQLHSSHDSLECPKSIACIVISIQKQLRLPMEQTSVKTATSKGRGSTGNEVYTTPTTCTVLDLRLHLLPQQHSSLYDFCPQTLSSSHSLVAMLQPPSPPRSSLFTCNVMYKSAISFEKLILDTKGTALEGCLPDGSMADSTLRC